MKRFLTAVTVVFIFLILILPLGRIGAAGASTYTFDPTYGTENPLKPGEYVLQLSTSKEYTLFVFCPDEIGIYEFSVESDATVRWWGGYTANVFYSKIAGSSIEREIKQVGDAAVIGITAADHEVTLTITKSGESEGLVEREYVQYVNEHIPVASVYPSDTVLKAVDITKPHSAVLCSDGFYRLNSENGQMIYVDLFTNDFNLAFAFGDYGALTMRGQYDGVYYEFKPAMKEYNEVIAGTSGVYPLTTDLIRFIKSYGEGQMWFNKGYSPFDAIEAGNADPASAWMVMCLLADEPAEVPQFVSVWDMDGSTPFIIEFTAAAHTAGQAVTYAVNNKSDGCRITVSGSGSFTVNYDGIIYPSSSSRVVIENVSKAAQITVSGSGVFEIAAETHLSCEKVEVEGSAPTHTAAGSRDYLLCEVCGKKYDADYSDSEITDEGELIIPALGHEGAVKVAESAPTCTDTGIAEHYFCDECSERLDGTSADARVLSEAEVTVAPTGHIGAVKVFGNAPTCFTVGTINYYQCNNCNAKFDSMLADARELSDDELTVAATGHANAAEIAAVAPSCTENGSIKYYNCADCGGKYAEKSVESKLLTDEEIAIAATGHSDFAWTGYKAPACRENGNLEHYYCDRCDAKFDGRSPDSKMLAEEDISLPATGHTDAMENAASAPTCTDSGNIKFYFCQICNAKFDSKEPSAAELSDGDITVPATAHANAVLVPAKAADCYENGNTEYYDCKDCGRKFSSLAEPAEISEEETVIYAGHSFSEYVQKDSEAHSRACARCGEEESEPHKMEGDKCSVCDYEILPSPAPDKDPEPAPDSLWDKIAEFFAKIFESIGNFFKNLFK